MAEDPSWSVLHLFRQMEVELGCFFASRAVCLLMEEHRQLAVGVPESAPAAIEPPTRLSDLIPALAREPGGGADQLFRELARLGLELPEGQSWTKAADLYFQAAPPREELSLAAAGTDPGNLVPVVALNLREGMPASWKVLEAQVTDFVGAPQVMVGGQIVTTAAGKGNWQAQFAWLDGDGKIVQCLASFFEVRDNGLAFFWAAFPLQAQWGSLAENRLRIRLFSETGR
jgi:hypothetical protein